MSKTLKTYNKKSTGLTRALCLLISISLILVLFAGCNKDKSAMKNEPENTQKEAGVSDKNGEDKDKENYILTVTIGDRFAKWSQNDMRDIWKVLQEKTGIKFKFECVPSDQYNNVMSIRLASNEKLPDLFTPPGTQNDVSKFFNEGLLIPLEGLIEQYGTNTMKYLNVHPEFKASLYTPEGKIPVVYSHYKDYLNFEPYWPMVRLDFLRNVNLEIPKTIDEFYNMLVKFKNKDANGNGDTNDEIPFSNQAWQHLLRIAEFFNARVGGDGFNPDDDGKIQYYFTNEKFKESLIFLNKLYREGLLDNEFTNMKTDKLVTKIANETVGAFVGYGHGNPTLMRTEIDDKFVMLPVLENHDGRKVWVGSSGVGSPFGISKDCKYPDLAMKWIDEYCFNRENYIYYILGIEGKNYTIENGEYKPTEWALNHPDKLTSEEVVKSLGGTPALSYPYDMEAWKLLFKYNVAKGLNHENHVSICTDNQKHIVNPFPFIYAEDKDIEFINRYINDITTYRDEMVIKFILGEESLDNFNKYIETLNSMGVKDILPIKQKQYDNYIKNVNKN